MRSCWSWAHTAEWYSNSTYGARLLAFRLLMLNALQQYHTSIALFRVGNGFWWPTTTRPSVQKVRDHLHRCFAESDVNEGDFPVLLDDGVKITGFTNIVNYLRNHHSGAYDLDYNLTHQQQTDRTAYVACEIRGLLPVL